MTKFDLKKDKVDYTLYLVTDRKLLGKRNIENAVEDAILGGVTLVQLREKNVSSREFYEIGLKVKKITDKYNIPLIVNDRLDIALAIDATGLHIGQSDLPVVIARKILGQEKVLGVSAGTVEEAIEAEKSGADYLGVGAVFQTNTKKDADSVKIDELKRIKSTVSIPVVAIGGISEKNVEQLKDTNIDGLAVVSAILGKQDIKNAANNLREIFITKFS